MQRRHGHRHQYGYGCADVSCAHDVHGMGEIDLAYRRQVSADTHGETVATVVVGGGQGEPAHAVALVEGLLVGGEGDVDAAVAALTAVPGRCGLGDADDLEPDPAGEGAARYLQRARHGMERLQAMMTALGAATRVEQAISSAESVVFDLGALVREMTAAYAAARPSLRIGGETPPFPCEIRGSPDLIAQMLDKLFENAVDFCPPGGSVDIGLARQPDVCVLTVANSGSRLPEALVSRLFDSMVSGRPEGGEGAHLGLGLHVARLIARQHGGQIRARNLPGPDGVEFSVEIPTVHRRPE